MAEDVLLSRCLVDLLPLFTRSQVHERVQGQQIIETKSTERLISLDAAQSVLAVRADRHDLALAFDAADNVAQSVLLCKTVAGGESLSVEGVFTDTADLVREALRVDNLALGLTCEHSLNLLKDRRKLHLRSL